jgi:hypothetical protein
MKRSYFKLEEVKLPFDELALNDDELFVIKGGENKKGGGSNGNCDCNCNCGCSDNGNCNCNCSCM